MRREGYVRGQQAEVVPVGCQVGQETVQPQVRAFGVLVDAEGDSEAVQEVQPMERAGSPQYAVAQLRRTDRGRVRQRMIGVEDRQLLGRVAEVQLFCRLFERSHLRQVQVHGCRHRREPMVVGSSRPLSAQAIRSPVS
ncbi:hypothetical protein [Nonomuraea wenchangensis]|uniref:hypothetical protein n=1 Tax=Nonomuraea wenchangensis TaxID=568860 RepID=UPI0015A59E63|nr:hypothetical protein [Nonomuraea wenchangensis]